MKQLFFIAFLLVACGSGGNKNNANSNSDTLSQKKQLNISILLDLSDRINPLKNSVAQKNDIENIKTITEFFKKNMRNLGAYKANGKIRIFFSPPPVNADINSIVSNLIIDCSKKDNKGRKEIYDTIDSLYTKSIESIYLQTIKTSDWIGSDIWRFFKDDVRDFCIEHDTSYRNILIVLTDGYLYHKQSKFNNQNRFTYLLDENLKQYRTQNWEQLVEQNNFGIMTSQENLSNLEVLVLEVKAESSNNKIDEDILQAVWKKWFKEMKVSRYEVYRSDLPAYTKTRIENFLNPK